MSDEHNTSRDARDARDTRECQECHVNKSLSDFPKRGKGISTSCKECVNKKGAATREKKKVEKQKSDARAAFNEHWKQTASNIDAYDLTQISELLKEYQKQIKTMQ